MERLPSVGIVGTAEQIAILVPIIKSVGFSVKALWCRDNEAAKRLVDHHDVPYCAPSFQDLLLLHEVKLVYVATEPVMQAEVAVKALTSGKHCICQQPPSVSRKEAEKMHLLSHYYSQLHSVIECPLRFLPCFVKLYDLVASGYIGDLLSMDARILTGSLVEGEPFGWKCDPAMGGGALNQIGSHIVDVICHVAGRGCSVQRVNCFLKTFKPQTESIRGYRSIESDDFCSLQLECSGNLVATVLINSCWAGQGQFELLVTGTKKQVVVKGLDLYSCRSGCSEMSILHKQDTVGTGVDPGETLHGSAGFYQSMVLGCTRMLQVAANRFTSRLDTNDHSLASFQEGLHLRAVLDSARESHRTGRWIKIPSSRADSPSSNPFWTTSTLKVDSEKPSPKPAHNVPHL